MQTLYRKDPTKLSSQTRKIATGAILLFALAGLISGFAVGAFVRLRPGTGTTHNTGSGTTPIAQSTRTATPITIHPVKMGDPVVTMVHYFEKADGTTNYTFTAYAVDQSIDKHHGKQIHGSGITCKLWLQRIPGGDFVNLPSDRLRQMDIQQPLTAEEIVGALSFAPGVSQIQPTDADGEVTWNYTVATSIDPGTYYLAVLMDWQGQSYNWSWKLVTIEK